MRGDEEKTFLSRHRSGKYLTNPSEEKAVNYGRKDTAILVFNAIAELFKELVAPPHDAVDIKLLPKERGRAICDVQKTRRLAIGATCNGIQEVLEAYGKCGVQETVDKSFRSWAREACAEGPFRSQKMQTYIDHALALA